MNTTTKAVRDALGTPIDNGPKLRRQHGRRTTAAVTIATPVVTSWAPLWRCDATTCPPSEREGLGGEAMLQHAAEHHGRVGVFTDRRHA